MNNKYIWIFAIAFGMYVYWSGSSGLDDYRDKTVEEFKLLTTLDRKDIVEEYISTRDLPSEAIEGIYSCVSQMGFTKSQELKFEEIAGWCFDDYKRGTIGEYTNFDKFENGFSQWDGAYRSLEETIKDSMNDSASYEHVQTRYRLILDRIPTAIVTTQFKGANAFGGIVKEQMSAKVSIETGQIIEIVQ